MEQYINKSALVAEIERRINVINLDSIEDWRYRLQREHDIEVMKNILSLIDTFEVKEVDLESEIENVRKSHFINSDFDKATLDGRDITNIARHFFELGLKVQKGE